METHLSLCGIIVFVYLHELSLSLCLPGNKAKSVEEVVTVKAALAVPKQLLLVDVTIDA